MGRSSSKRLVLSGYGGGSVEEEGADRFAIGGIIDLPVDIFFDIF
jgi:hypothetical protein